MQVTQTGTASLPALLRRWRLGATPATPQPAAQRLGDWLAWTDAIVLAQTLATPVETGPEPLAATADWAAAALARLRAELQASFADTLLVDDNTTPTGMSFNDVFAPYRLHHAQQQRALIARVGTLRERLRAKLAAGPSPRLARLAQLDAVFERAVAERQRQASSALPALLAQRAAALHASRPTTWCAALWDELQALLAAELDLTLQPVLGLHEALTQDLS